jgi:hypothetical protein
MPLFGVRRALLTGPHPPGSSRLCRLRGFHHWFTARCTVLPCLLDPGRLAVPTRPVVVRAAPTLPGASQAGLPSASAGLLRQPSGGSFHPTRSHNASWRTPLSPCTLPGRRRRRPVGLWIGGMSSSTASSMVESLALAALTITVNGTPPASPATCSLDPYLPRSTGLAPVRSPVDRPQAEGVDADSFQVDPAGLAELVQQDLKGAQRRSCSSSVLVEGAAQQVASTHAASPILASDDHAGWLVWRVQLQRPVRRCRL